MAPRVHTVDMTCSSWCRSWWPGWNGAFLVVCCSHAALGRRVGLDLSYKDFCKTLDHHCFLILINYMVSVLIMGPPLVDVFVPLYTLILVDFFLFFLKHTSYFVTSYNIPGSFAQWRDSVLRRWH